VNLFCVKTNGPFPQKGPGKSVFHDEGAIKVQTIMLRAGQSIPPCAMDYDVMFYVVKGTGTLVVNGRTIELQAGSGVVVPKETKSREMRAGEDLTILAVQGRTERS